MASLWKHPQSQYFTACWTGADGRRMKRSTKTAIKKTALKMARRFEEESRSRRTAKQARRILADVYRSLSGEELPAVKVREYFTTYVERKRPEVSKSTLDYYASNSRRFLAWLGPRAEVDISEITKAEITGYRNHAAAAAGPTTTNNTLKAVKTFFAAARKDGYLIDDPAVDVDTVRDRTESSRRPFTLDELRALLSVADPQWRSMVLFGLYTGQRLGDVATLTWQNVDVARDEIRLTTRKTGRRQTLPLAPPLREHIATLPASDDPRSALHPRAAATVQRTGRTGILSKEFAGILTAAGLRAESSPPSKADPGANSPNFAASEAGKAHGKRAETTSPETGYARTKYQLSFHSLRHTATSLLKTAGIPQSVVMDYIGHDSADVSHGYTHTGREALEKAAASFPSL